MNIFYKRIEWLKKYVKENDNCFDMLNVDFVDSFISKFDVKHDTPFIGARHCPTLSRFLTESFSLGYVKRNVIPIMEGRGFPKWIYGYSLRPEYL